MRRPTLNRCNQRGNRRAPSKVERGPRTPSVLLQKLTVRVKLGYRSEPALGLPDSIRRTPVLCGTLLQRRPRLKPRRLRGVDLVFPHRAIRRVLQNTPIQIKPHAFQRCFQVHRGSLLQPRPALKAGRLQGVKPVFSDRAILRVHRTFLIQKKRFLAQRSFQTQAECNSGHSDPWSQAGLRQRVDRPMRLVARQTLNRAPFRKATQSLRVRPPEEARRQ